jgi:GxxExxY protein
MNEDISRTDKIDDLERFNAITEKIIGCAFKVSNTLGVGFVEKVYENAFAYELIRVGLRVEQ